MLGVDGLILIGMSLYSGVSTALDWVCFLAIVSVAPGLTCLETWKAYAPSAVCKSKKFITIKKLTGE